MSASLEKKKQGKAETENFGKSSNGKKEKMFQDKQTDISKRPVIIDKIHKQIIHAERKLQSSWEQKYGHLSGEIFQKVLVEEAEKAGLPARAFMRKELEDPRKNSPIFLPSSPPIPLRSSAIVGWRSARKECNLEFTGPMYVPPTSTIEPPLEDGEFRVVNQKFIFLG